MLFKAYEDADIVAEWMGTKVLKLENKRHGSYRFETTDPKGNKHYFNGTIHEFEPSRKITGLLKWKALHFLSNWNFLNSTSWVQTEASSACKLYINRWLIATRCYNCLLQWE
ncbi:MAG: SRPBCC domain-containing protein [Saprospiraceae bacterium]